MTKLASTSQDSQTQAAAGGQRYRGLIMYWMVIGLAVVNGAVLLQFLGPLPTRDIPARTVHAAPSPVTKPTAMPQASAAPLAATPAVAVVPTHTATPAITPAVARVPATLAAPFAEPTMVAIPSGRFRMGSREDPSEQPLHDVAVAAFRIAAQPVTAAQWNLCVVAGACDQKAVAPPDRPVTNVSWNDARAYAAWLSKTSGHAYRLPSEAEWEYAARAGSTTRYWWGNTMLSGHANCLACGSSSDALSPPLVTALPPNGFGLLGMGGGVPEWVEDCWHRNYQGAPASSMAWESASCAARVLRGGGWMEAAGDQRASSREFYDPGVRYQTHGFRLASAP